MQQCQQWIAINPFLSYLFSFVALVQCHSIESLFVVCILELIYLKSWGKRRGNFFIFSSLTCNCCVSSKPSGKSAQLVSNCWEREVTKCFAFIPIKCNYFFFLSIYTDFAFYNTISNHKHALRAKFITFFFLLFFHSLW